MGHAGNREARRVEGIRQRKLYSDVIKPGKKGFVETYKFWEVMKSMLEAKHPGDAKWVRLSWQTDRWIMPDCHDRWSHKEIIMYSSCLRMYAWTPTYDDIWAMDWVWYGDEGNSPRDRDAKAKEQP